MFKISKEFTFEAAHHLTKVPEGHKCRNPHGHSYRVIIELESFNVDERGFVVDYNDLGIVKEWLDREWDHKDLNEWFFRNTLNRIEPTAENLALYLFYCFSAEESLKPYLKAVKVSETAKTWAEYRKGS